MIGGGPMRLAGLGALAIALVLLGACGAGVLAGWKYSNVGRAPQFDIVTGVSTGALLAPLVFVGDDTTAKVFYTTLAENDIYRTRSAFELLTSNSLLDATPLQNR